MLRTNRSRTWRVAVVAATLVIAGLVQAGAAQAAVTDVRGTAFGSFASVMLGTSLNRADPTPVITLPVGGSSTLTANAGTSVVAFPPANFFTSGPVTVSTQGSTGASGSVTSSASITTINTSGDEVFTASSASSTCTATESTRSGSVTVNGGTIRIDSGDNEVNGIPDHPPVDQGIPTNPAPNTVIAGHIHVNGTTETFQYVINEQILGADGSITVTIGHLKMLGPFAVGDLYIGQSVCSPKAGFTSLAPARILDTRTPVGGHQAKVNAGTTVDVGVTGVGSVPASGVGAVVLNVTVDGPTQNSFLTVYPAGTPFPGSSNLNFVAGQTVPNLVVAKVSTGGHVTIFNGAGSTDVIFDVVGWFASSTSSFTSLTPSRILDTRTTVGGHPGKVVAGTTVDVTVTGVGGVPAAGSVGAVVMNVTVDDPTQQSFLSVYPAGTPFPGASNLNFVAGQTVPNLVVAKVSAGGQVTIFNGAGATHVIFDVVGWFPPSTTSFTSLTPSRILDTRTTVGGHPGKVVAGTTVDVTVTGVGGVPATGVGAVVMNVTVDDPTQPSFLSVYPAGTPFPGASNLNFVAGQTVPNLVVAKVGTGGQVTIFNGAGATHVIFDVVGWFAP